MLLSEKRIVLDNMSKREYKLPIHDVIMGLGLGARADRGGWNNPKETLANSGR